CAAGNTRCSRTACSPAAASTAAERRPGFRRVRRSARAAWRRLAPRRRCSPAAGAAVRHWSDAGPSACLVRHRPLSRRRGRAAPSMVALCVAGLTLAVGVTRPIAGLGVPVFPLAACLLGIDVFLAPPTVAQPIAWQIQLHVAFALVGYSVLSIAAVLAILLALQERALRRHRPGSGLVRALPPLTLTESLMFRLIAAGFALLSLTLLSGALFVDDLFAQHLVHKTVLSIVAWIVFGVLLFGRWRWGWRGPRARSEEHT